MHVEIVTKRLAIFSAILIFSAAAALAQSDRYSIRSSKPLLDDIVQMTEAGLADATIVAYVKARRARADSVSADDLIQLRRARVGEPVIQYLAGVAALDGGGSREARQGDITYDSGEGTAYPVEPSYDGAYAYPYEYGYWPGGYWPYGFSSSVVIGGRPFFGRRLFFRRPFFRNRFFFRRPFFHHQSIFRRPNGRRPFFRGRR